MINEVLLYGNIKVCVNESMHVLYEQKPDYHTYVTLLNMNTNMWSCPLFHRILECA